MAAGAHAQSIEPRAYSPAPSGVNFIIVGYAHATGGLSFDTSAPITDAHIKTDNPILAYARTLDIWGRSAKVDVILPIGRLSGSALYQGEPVSREVMGLGDPLVRLSVNLYGAPAMSASQFRTYHQDVIVGASVQVSAPAGQYDSSRLLNIGSNRWMIKPAVGASKAFGQWVVEFEGAATFYSDNEDFFGGHHRSQKPLYSGQAHAIYNFRSGAWASLDATYFTGGRSTLDGVLNNDLQENWRIGATLAFPLDRRNSIKLYASSGVSARTGNNFDAVGVAWQHRWGGGL